MLYPLLSSLRQRLLFHSAAPSDALIDRNIRYLYLEILFGGVLAAAINFNATFAIRLGASKEIAALLSSLPYMVMALFSIPLTRFMLRRQRRKRWFLGVLLALRLGYLLLAVIPTLYAANYPMAAGLIVLWIILLTLPQTLVDNEWRLIFGELVPEKRRPFVLSRRLIILSLTVALATVVVGWWLNQTHDWFPLNYQLLYGVGIVVSLGSSYFLSRLTIPDRTAQELTLKADPAPKKTKMVMTSSMKRLLFTAGVYHFGLQFYNGVGTIHFVNNLKATDDWIGLTTAMGSIGGIIGFWVWERWLRKHDLNWALRRASLFTWIFPVMFAYFHNLPLIVLANFLVNLMHPGVELSSTNLLLKLPREEDRGDFNSTYMTIISGCSLIAPPLGVWLSGVLPLGIPGVIFMSGALRLLGGILFNILRVDEHEREEIGDSVVPAVST